VTVARTFKLLASSIYLNCGLNLPTRTMIMDADGKEWATNILCW